MKCSGSCVRSTPARAMSSKARRVACCGSIPSRPWWPSSRPGEGYQLRDLRRTTETRLASLRVDKETRAQLLSHGRTTGVQNRHYDRWHYLDEKRAALSLWEHHLRAVLAGQATSGKVVALR